MARMITVNELRGGTVFTDHGEPFMVVKYTHTKMGRGNAVIRIKAKNLKTGGTLEKTFMSGAAVEEADVEKVKCQYLYTDSDGVHFMDNASFEQITFPREKLEWELNFLKEGLEVYLLMIEGKPATVDLPPNVALTVKETEPGYKGDSATTVQKPATMETGFLVNVPLFIKENDRIKVDTRSGEYVERA